jgi:hypothetical protein
MEAPTTLTPAHLIQLWQEHEDAGEDFTIEVPVIVKTKIINKGEFTCTFPISSISYDVDDPENTVKLKICGVFVPWDPVRKLFCNERYCFDIMNMQLDSKLAPAPTQ